VDLVHPRALSGPGGIGKTQTAVVYAYKYRAHYQSVLWIKADTRSSLISDMRKIAHLLKVPGEKLQDDSQLIATVTEWFKKQSDWLLILDNADDIPMVEAFIPMAARGHILLTSRAQATAGFAEHIELEKLSPEDGSLFILRRSGIVGPHGRLGDTTEAKRAAAQAISRLVDGLPLALEQAGAYIEETACGVSRYLRLYQVRSDEIRRLRSGPVPDYPEAVATTWDVSMQAVQATNPAAAELLRFFAFLGPDAIPEEIITQGAPHLGPLLQPIAGDPLKFNTAIRDLLKYSLIRRDTDRNTDTSLITVHRLVQEVQKDAMDLDRQRLWAEQVVRAVSQVFLHGASDDEQLYHTLLPHVQVCANLISQWKMTFIEAEELLQKMTL
jgi:NB-ARC domain